jgi:hypothetical protein
MDVFCIGFTAFIAVFGRKAEPDLAYREMHGKCMFFRAENDTTGVSDAGEDAGCVFGARDGVFGSRHGVNHGNVGVV